jgi:hypothetical protein
MLKYLKNGRIRIKPYNEKTGAAPRQYTHLIQTGTVARKMKHEDRRTDTPLMLVLCKRKTRIKINMVPSV